MEWKGRVRNGVGEWGKGEGEGRREGGMEGEQEREWVCVGVWVGGEFSGSVYSTTAPTCKLHDCTSLSLPVRSRAGFVMHPCVTST